MFDSSAGFRLPEPRHRVAIMNQVPAWRDTDGTWWIGTPHAWHIAPVEARHKAAALAATLAGLGITREDLFFEPEELREKFDTEFGSRG